MLGRGLESLIPPQNPPKSEPEIKSAVEPIPSTKKATPEAIFLIETEKIKPNPYQPRRDFNEESIKELAASIQEFGILQPLLVTKIEQETETGTQVSYQLIAGERRFLAAKMLGLERVPAIIKKVNLEANRLEMAIIENLQRSNLNPLEAARAFAKLQDEFKLTQREISQKVGKSREAIANTMRLLSLPSNIQEALTQNKINESQARTLLAVDDLNQQQTLFRELLTNNLSVRDLREKIRTAAPTEVGTNFAPTGREDPEKKYLENQLEEVLGTKVKISQNQNKGKITIRFFSAEELDSIIKKICSERENSKPTDI
jgi:ParB family chromosome partitioning protein